MSLDPTKAQFTTTLAVDKIPVYSTKTDGQGFGGNASMSVGVVQGNANVTTTIYIATLVNPYGKRCLVTFSWSLDGVNYYPQNIPIYYFNATYQEFLWQALGFGGCSDSTVYFCCSTQYDVAPQTMYLQIALDSPT